VGVLTLLSKEEKDRLLYDFNATEAGYPEEKTIHQLFKEQVEQTPDNISAVGPLQSKNRTYMTYKTHISYRELNEKADRLAAVLQEKGVQPDTIAAVKVERSIEMIIGILGILKAGGAYLPIDPDYPEERIQYMLNDSNAKVLVSEGSELSKVSKGIEMIKPSELGEELPTHLTHLTHSTQLCYIIYTSGSTGKPKGVLVQHRSAVNILFALDREYPFNESDTYLLKTSYMFDVSVSELFGWFLGGGKLAIMEKNGEKDPGKILDTIESEGVTHINFVPSMFNAFVEMLSPGNISKLSGLEYIFLAGEALWPELIVKFRRFNTGIALENIYGPTEGTIYAGKYPLSSWRDSPAVPIGKPMQNIKLYILDKYNHAQPVGITGELCIGGAGLARGYLNNPELTAEKFDHDLWEKAPGKKVFHRSHKSHKSHKSYMSYKLYKTGDLAEWLPDGNIRFLGRLDHQVKIRGFRIELPEIENRLARYPGIKEVVIICRHDQQEDKSLCAYIVSDHDIPASELKEYLLTYLPGYMIPVYFSRLEQMPLTPSGKIDRKALPAPGIKTGEDYVTPRNQVEEKLTGIWAGVLALEKEQIGIDDNFFRLGGHSINATILMARIHKELDVKLPLPEIFERKTIRELAQYIKKSGKSKYQGIQSLEKREYYGASYGQKRIWLLSQSRESSLSFNMSGTHFFPVELNIDVLNKVFASLIQRHESLRTVFLSIEGEIKQGVLPSDEMKFSVDYKDFKAVENKESIVDGLLESESNTPFDLLRGPLFRIIVIQLETKNYLLLFTMHHVIADFLSLEVLTGEFLQLYESLIQGGKDPLRPLRIQYKDFASWQNKQLQGPELERLRKYWHSRFDGKIPGLELPYDRARPEVRSYKGEYVDFNISADITAKLSTIAGENSATLFMVLFASIDVLLHFYTGQTNIILGLAASGREHQDLENQIGFYLNILALKTTFREKETFIRLLEIVRKRALEAYEHQMYPFDLLIDDLKIKREPGRHPLFDIAVDMTRLKQPSNSPNDLPGEPVETGENEDLTNNYKGRSKFDLAIYFFVGEGNINVTFEYNTDLFERKTITRMSKRFGTLLESITRDPGASISKLLLEEEINIPAFAPFAAG
jgi:amino acid adenylation domain-containing protein